MADDNKPIWIPLAVNLAKLGVPFMEVRCPAPTWPIKVISSHQAANDEPLPDARA